MTYDYLVLKPKIYLFIVLHFTFVVTPCIKYNFFLTMTLDTVEFSLHLSLAFNELKHHSSVSLIFKTRFLIHDREIQDVST